MAQFLRPTSDKTNPASWTGSYVDIDEVVASDGDFGYSGDAAVDTYETGFQDTGVNDPNSATGHIVRVRHSELDGGVFSTAFQSSTVLIALYQGTTLIATVYNGTVTGWTTTAYTLTSGEANSITNYNDLRVRVDYAGNDGGGVKNDRGVGISWIEMEIPEVGNSIIDPVDTGATFTTSSAIFGKGSVSCATDLTFSEVCAIGEPGTVDQITGSVRFSLNCDNSYYFRKEANSEIPTTTDSNTLYNLSVVVRARFTDLLEGNCLLGTVNNSTALWFRKDINDDLSVQLSANAGITSVDTNATWTVDLDWHNFAFSYDGTNLKLFVDGTEVATKVDADFLGYTASNMFQIGRRGGNTTGTMDGYISAVRIWNRALTPTEQTNVGGNIDFDISSGLIADYREQKGATWIDNVSAQVGTPSNTTFGGATLKVLLGSISGTASFSLGVEDYKFDGTDSSHFTTNYDLASLVNFTWIVNAKLNLDKSNNGFLTDGTDGARLRFYTDASGVIRAQARDNIFTSSIIKAWTSDFLYHQYAFSYDGISTYLHIDGVQIDTEPNSDFLGYLLTTTNSLIIGRGVLTTGDTLDGNMKTVQLYDTKLTSEQLLRLAVDINAISTNKILDFNEQKTDTQWTDNVSGYIATNAGNVKLNPALKGKGIITATSTLTLSTSSTIQGKGLVQNGTEKYTSAGATTLVNDANVLDWSNVGGITTVETGIARYGDYCVKVEADSSATWDRADFTFTNGSSGKYYRVSLWANQVVGVDAQFSNFFAVTGHDITPISQGWKRYSFNLKSTSLDGNFIIKVLTGDGAEVIGDYVLIDGLSIVEGGDGISFGTVCAIADASSTSQISGTASLTFATTSTIQGKGIVQNGIETYPQDNVASIFTEIDSVTLWVGNNNIVSVAGVGKADTATAHSGDYSIRNITEAIGNARMGYVFTVASGVSYKVSWWVKGAVGDETWDWRFENAIASGTDEDGLPATASTAWTKQTATWKSEWTGSAEFKIWNNGAINDVIYVDSISILQNVDGIKFGTVCAIADASAGSISGSSTLTFSEANSVNGKGSVSGDATLTFTATSDRIGNGYISGSSSLTFTETLTPSAKGTIELQADLLFSETNALLARGNIDASSDLTFATSSSIQGKGSAIGNSDITFSEVCGLADVGDYSISGTASLTHVSSATIIAKGSVTASSDITFSTDLITVGKGLIAITSFVDFTSTTSLEAKGIFGATTFPNFVTSSGVSAKGIQTGISDLTFTEVCSLTDVGDYSISGTASLTFVSSSTIQAKGLFGTSAFVDFVSTSSIQSKGIITGSSSLTFSETAGISNASFSQITGTASITFTDVVGIAGKTILTASTGLTFSTQLITLGKGLIAVTSFATFSTTASIASGEQTLQITGSSSLTMSSGLTTTGRAIGSGQAGLTFITVLVALEEIIIPAYEILLLKSYITKSALRCSFLTKEELKDSYITKEINLKSII